MLYVHTHGNWCPSASAGSGTAEEPCEEASHENQSKVCFVFGLNPVPSNTGQDCVTTVFKSAHSQISTVLFYAKTMKSVQARICTDPMCVSCLQPEATISQTKHWSHSRRVCWTCSTAPDLTCKTQLNEHHCMCLYSFADVKNLATFT